ncbi:YggS family pyridoxal phosphate-dependent enzyme [Patescibacteria group bacterium AH-259-L07]|nr:YggS family pyridoxal phosphate-dependent enzyme [Patescibacteria group bacterium AH-259-L07]
MFIRQRVQKILNELPYNVELVVAVKTRSLDEIRQAIEAGAKIIGQNYVQDAEKIYQVLDNQVTWHLIGHLQTNKVKKAVTIFDMIQTVDSFRLAKEIHKRCEQNNKNMPILIEINSAREKQKSGVFPEKTIKLVKDISGFKSIKVMGLMTMGPRTGDPENSRPYFIKTRKIFDYIKNLNLDNIEMKYLSMGMTNSYKIAIEEGANIVRIGTKIFDKNWEDL